MTEIIIRKEKPPVWNDEAIEILAEGWARGLSTGMIANQLNAKGYVFTRNAVIGKKHRLGLPAPDTKKVPKAREKKVKVKLEPAIRVKPNLNSKFFVRRKPRPIRVEIKEVEMVSVPDGSNAVSLVDARDGQCRQIIRYENGELGKAVFCGDPTPVKYVRGRISHNPWCAYHHEKNTYQDRR